MRVKSKSQLLSALTPKLMHADPKYRDLAGREWSMKYQLKRAESRSGRTRTLAGWRPLSAAMGLAAGDVLAIERISEPRALPLLLTVSVLARAVPPAAGVAMAEPAEGNPLVSPRHRVLWLNMLPAASTAVTEPAEGNHW